MIVVANADPLVVVARIGHFCLSRIPQIHAETRPVLEARLDKATEGQLQQVAFHLSKMEGGESIGGFPGFEPPDDDEEYQRKIRDRTYSPQDVNDWVREINNFLDQIVKRNPDLSLEEILQKQGLASGQIEEFLDALREAHTIASGMKGYGVRAKTVETFESLMTTLGVSQWVY